MCGGDGLADIIGRRFGGNAKLPHNSNKSWAGSAAMFAGAVASALEASTRCENLVSNGHCTMPGQVLAAAAAAQPHGHVSGRLMH